MSGRIAALDARQEKDGKVTLYIGAASGGVWKSEDGGTTFQSKFDKQGVQSIGAIAIDPTNPRTIWVGTGESWTRNSVSIGDGIYKSVDGGDNWTQDGPAQDRAHHQDRRPPDQRQHRLCLRPRPLVVGQPGPRPVQAPSTAARPGRRS